MAAHTRLGSYERAQNSGEIATIARRYQYQFE